MPIRRRRLLLSTAVVFAAACRGVVAPSPTPKPALPREFDLWTQEAQAILSDALQTLRTFEDFQAFRVSTASESSMRLASELAWDAPASGAWDEAIHVTRGVHGRADHLFTAVTTARIDPTLWRNQRTLADATHELLDLGDALSAYRDRAEGMPPGDATGALPLLDKAWAQWDTAAERWGISRAESIGCASA